MRAFILFLVLIPLAISAQDEKTVSQWGAIKYFEGSWIGESTGKAGEGKGERTYEYIMNRAYLHYKNIMKFEPQENNPKGEVHEDWGFFSWDNNRQIIVLRQFNIEKFTNQFIADSISTDGKTLLFTSESSENAPPRLTARYIFEIKDENTFIETFELAFPGNPYSCWMTNTWRRKTN